MKYSAVVLAHNEQHNITVCIDNIQPVANEVVVIDDYSSDDTANIAEGLGAIVFQRNLNGNWAEQRNFGLDQTKSDWTLMVDADERLTETALGSVASFSPSNSIKAGKLNRLNFYKDKPLRHGRFYADPQIKVLRSDLRYGLERPVHEIPEVEENEVVVLQGDINHFTYTSARQMFEKIRRYSIIEAESGQPVQRARVVRHLLRLPMQHAYLDGMPGMISLAADIYGALTYDHIRLRQALGKKQSDSSIETLVTDV